MSGAVLTPVVRGADDQRPFDPVRISPSRVNAYLSCGVAFERKYLQKEKPQLLGSAALFGNVMHLALEKWALNREQDLVTLTAQAWMEQTRGTPVSDFIVAYQSISIECMKAEAEARIAFEARNKGKESKAPRMTREFKESPAAKKLGRLLAIWIPKLNEGSPWRFSERDPLPNLYDESLIVAKKYSRLWKDELPTALLTEFAFNVEWNGFLLNGYIDAIEPVVAPAGELAGYGVCDYKTYRADPPGAKDWRQGVIYDIAFEALCRSGALPFDPELDRWVVFDYVRLLRRHDYRVMQADREVLLRDLQMYRDGVTAGVFLPAQKNQNPDFCDYEDCCLNSRGAGTGCRGGLYPEESS